MVRVWRNVSLIIAAVVFVRLGFSSTHTHISTDTHSAALLGNYTRKSCTLGQARELLCAEDGERDGLDLETEIHVLHWLSRLHRHGHAGRAHRPDRRRRHLVLVLVILGFLVQTEVESVEPLVSDREVWEDEVAGLAGTVEICDACNWNTGQDGTSGRLALHSAVSIRTSPFKRCEKEEVGVV